MFFAIFKLLKQKTIQYGCAQKEEDENFLCIAREKFFLLLILIFSEIKKYD